MEFLYKHLLVFFVALGAALLLTPLAKAIAPALGLVDKPSERRIHKKMTPRNGGIAVFLATHFAMLLVFFGPWKNLSGSVQANEWLTILIGSSLLLGVGLIDDRFGMKAGAKLAGQLGVALLMFFNGFSFETFLGMHVPVLLSLSMTLFWFILLINAFNLIDGMDGACAGLGAISGSGLVIMLLFLHQPADALVLIALVGACLGFLRYNFSPASIFLGDCGSMFIGFLLAAVSLKANVKQSMVVALLIPLVAGGIPVLDVAMAVWRRLARKVLSAINQDGAHCKIFGPDLDHLHHKLLKGGMSQCRAALILYLGATLVCLLAVSCALLTSYRNALLLLCMVGALHVIVRQVARLELCTSSQVLLRAIRRPRAMIRGALHIGSDVVILTASTLVALKMVLGSFTVSITVMACAVGIPFLTLYSFGIYRTIWARSRPFQLLALFSELFTGEILTYLVLLRFSGFASHDLLLIQSLHFLYAAAGIVGLRMAPRLLRDIASWLRRFLLSETCRKTILVGGGHESLLCLRQMASEPIHQLNRKIEGMVDGDPQLLGKTIYGYPILGAIHQLDALIQQHQIDELIICKTEAVDRASLLALKKKHNLMLCEFSPALLVVEE